MPSATVAQAKIELSAENKTDAAFRKVGQNLATLQTGTGSAATALTKLGVAGGALYAGSKLLDFLKDAGQLALEDDASFTRMAAALSQMGASASDPAIQGFLDRMKQLGQTVGDTEDGLTKLIRTTKNTTEAIYLSKLASDLAASGMGDYSSNVDALTGLLQGRARQAAQQFGINMKENASASDALNEITKRVTVTMEQFGDTAAGTAKRIGTAWTEIKGDVGSALIAIGGAAIKGFDFFSDLSDKWASALSLGAVNGKDPVAIAAEQVRKMNEARQMEQGKADAIEQAQRQVDADAQKALQDKLEQSYRDYSKSVVQAFSQQEDAIAALKKSMADLDDKLADSISKADQSYKADVANVARTAKQRIDEIDKQIASENEARSKGFRTRIADLEAEKAKEQAIIAKAGSVVGNIQDQIAKDDLDRLAEAHAATVQQLKDDEEKQKLQAQAEMLQRQAFVLGAAVNVNTPGYLSKAASEGVSYLGSIGSAPTQQALIFNFNGAVAGDDGIQKIIESTIAKLNREATLRGVGGK